MEILEAPPRVVGAGTRTEPIKFGTIGHGLDLPRLAWPHEQQAFSLQDMPLQGQLPNRPRRQEGKAFSAQPQDFLRRNPVEVLLIEGSARDKNGTKLAKMIRRTPEANRPKVIAITDDVNSMVFGKEVRRRKQRRKGLENLGYTGIEWMIQSCDHGGALDQEVVVDLYLLGYFYDTLPLCPSIQELPARPMRNLLLPCGIPKRDWAPKHLVETLDTPIAVGPRLVSGYVMDCPVYHPDGCMPDETDCWVESDRGIRRLQPIELGKGKGLPGEWLTPKSKLPWSVVKPSVSLHTWTKIYDSLSKWLRDSKGTGPATKNKCNAAQHPAHIDPDEHNVETAEDRAEAWQHQMPDLSRTSRWYEERVQNLKQVIHGRCDAEELLKDGLEALEIHRANYTEQGPRYLQLLWWEFPEKHREEVRLGSSMRFLIDPGKELVPNPPMTEE